MFPYLGKFNLDWNRIEKYYNSISYDDWDTTVSAVDNHATNPFRPVEEQNHYLWYNKYNCLVKNIRVTEQDFFPDSWFYTLQAKKENYSAKIFWTKPGNFEPPHKDFFPSFLGEYKENGSKWTQKDIENHGKKIIRAWIPLMDSKLGHMLYSDEYALASWKKGDVFELPSGMTHGFANGGREDRLLMVFTAWRDL